MHTTSNPVSTAAIAFEDVLKGLSSTLASTDTVSSVCGGFDRKK